MKRTGTSLHVTCEEQWRQAHPPDDNYNLHNAFVELAGVEPASKHGSHMLSTCLVLLDFRDLSAAEQPNLSLFPVCFAIGPEKPSD